MAPSTVKITTAARRMCRETNGEGVTPGFIYYVNLQTGRFGALAGTYAVTKTDPTAPVWQEWGLWRVSHGKSSQAECQRFLDARGEGY